MPVTTYAIHGFDNNSESLSVVNKNLLSIAQNPNTLLIDENMPKNTLSGKQKNVFKRQKKRRAKCAKKRNTNIIEEKLDKIIFKLIKLCFMENNNLKTQVKKENIKEIFEKKSIFGFLSFKLGIVFKILQKIDYLAQKQ